MGLRIPILAVLIIALVAVTAPFAEEKKEKPAEYSVTLNVRYNAVSAGEVVRILHSALVEHKKSCKVTAKIELLDRNPKTLDQVSRLMDDRWWIQDSNGIWSQQEVR